MMELEKLMELYHCNDLNPKLDQLSLIIKQGNTTMVEWVMKLRKEPYVDFYNKEKQKRRHEKRPRKLGCTGNWPHLKSMWDSTNKTRIMGTKNG